jgi:hypothetical protein
LCAALFAAARVLVAQHRRTPGSAGSIIKCRIARCESIQTSEENIQIELFDNGTIDHDSISVFDNNKQVIKNGELSYTPIKLNIKFSADDNKHELIMVAENLGEIPPNTALMVITAGKLRYEVFLTSTEEKNAKVIIEYTSKK